MATKTKKVRTILPSPPGNLQGDELAPGERAFIGDGSFEIPVPGLEELWYVRIGYSLEAAPEFVEHNPVINEEGHTSARDVPLFEMDRSEQVLRRAHLSNDGRFQKGLRFVVAGKWPPVPES